MRTYLAFTLLAAALLVAYGVTPVSAHLGVALAGVGAACVMFGIAVRQLNRSRRKNQERRQPGSRR